MKMMMYRCTSKKPFAPGVFEIADLEHYTEQFNNEYAADNQEQDFIPCYQTP